MKLHKGKKLSSEAAIPVSYRLQFYTVVAAIAAAIIQPLFIVTSTGVVSGGAHFDYLLPALWSSTLFPLIVFIIAFATSRKYPVAIGRWFVAVIKTFIVMAAFSILQATWHALIVTLYNPVSYHGGVPPSWVTSNVSYYGATALALAAMLLFIYWQSKKKK